VSHCLVTFLGRTPREAGGAYKKADYHFRDGHVARAAFFGFPLRDWLAADRLVVFGTAGSMWDHLFEGDIEVHGADDERLALIDDVRAKNAPQDRLDRLTPYLAAHLGCDVQLTLIPEALETAEQTHLVRMLADAAEGAEHLSLDVTHGYRHLPMLAFAASLYLRILRPELSIEGLWYGSLNPDTSEAAVHDLRGLLEIADWLSALQQHESLGSYDGIAELLETGDADLAEQLRMASFRESIHQGQQARKNIRTARDRLESLPLTGPAELFKPILAERMGWVDEQSLYLRQRRQALEALKRHDYLRTSLYSYEAFITALVHERKQNPDLNDHATRKDVREAFWEQRHQETPAVRNAYELLLNVRNVLAHGNRARTPEAQRAIANAEDLHAALRDCIDTLLPAQQQ
jgi:CRISPR-associated Csx2 family protein